MLAEGARERVAAELRVAPRSGGGADVDQLLNARVL
jgi:hypothetical protein